MAFHLATLVLGRRAVISFRRCSFAIVDNSSRVGMFPMSVITGSANPTTAENTANSLSRNTRNIVITPKRANSPIMKRGRFVSVSKYDTSSKWISFVREPPVSTLSRGTLFLSLDLDFLLSHLGPVLSLEERCLLAQDVHRVSPLIPMFLPEHWQLSWLILETPLKALLSVH